MRTTIRAAALAVLVGSAGAACTTTRAAAPVERPALEVPPPPPRVVVPLPVPQPNQLEPVENLAPGPIVPPKPRVQRENPSQKVEPKPEEPKPVEPPPVTPPAQPPAAAPQLRLPENSNSPQVSQITQVIERAKTILSKIDFNPLPAAAKKAYKESQMFAGQADDALKANNLALAKELAEKAEALAKGIQGR